MTHGPLSWRELVERDKQKSEDAHNQIKRAAMPVQAEPVAELRAEITRLTEALRAAEEREKALREALAFYARENSWKSCGMYMSGRPNPSSAELDAGNKARQALAGAKPC